MKRGLELDYAVELEPHVGPWHTSHRADLKLTPKASYHHRLTVTSDLTIVDEQCGSNLQIMEKALTDPNAPSPDAPMYIKCGHQVEALFEKHRQRKDKHYRDRSVTGVTPWIVTTYGRIDHLFSLWLRHHSTSVRDYVCSAICAKLLKSRTLRLSAKPF